MSKNPLDLGVDLRIIQHCKEGMIETTWPPNTSTYSFLADGVVEHSG
jgi:hypothetical protein